MKKLFVISLISLSACSSVPLANEKAITIQYDPIAFKSSTIGAQAEAHCATHNKVAVPSQTVTSPLGYVEKTFLCQ